MFTEILRETFPDTFHFWNYTSKVLKNFKIKKKNFRNVKMELKIYNSEYM